MRFDTNLMHLLQQIEAADEFPNPKARLRGVAIEHIAKTHKVEEAQAIWVLEALIAIFIRDPNDSDPLNVEALKVLELQ